MAIRLGEAEAHARRDRAVFFVARANLLRLGKLLAFGSVQRFLYASLALLVRITPAPAAIVTEKTTAQNLMMRMRKMKKVMMRKKKKRRIRWCHVMRLRRCKNLR